MDNEDEEAIIRNMEYDDSSNIEYDASSSDVSLVVKRDSMVIFMSGIEYNGSYL